MEQQLQPPPGVTLREVGIDEEEIVKAVNTVLANTRLDPPRAEPDVPLQALGLSSLDMAELFVALEELAGGEIDAQSVTSTMTVKDLTSLRCLQR